jgi:hypothetical protein
LDPLTDMYPFQNGYAYAANDPINFIDVEGLGPGPAGQIVTVAGKTTVKITAPVATVMNAVSAVSKIASPASKIALGLGLAAKSLVIGLGQSLVNNKNNDDGWKPLYKADLQLYFREKNNEVPPTENQLGDLFMDLFEDYVDEKPFLKHETNVRRYGGPKFTGGDRNTVPDFIGDVLVVGKKTTRVKGSDWFELKQKGGGLYLSSDEGQIRGHIDNIKRNSEDMYVKYGRLGYQSKFWVITTADVKFSPGISTQARLNNVAYEHVHAEYRIVKNKWQFRFKKIVSR